MGRTKGEGVVKDFRHHVPVGSVVQIVAESLLFFGSVLLAVFIQLSPYGVDVTKILVSAAAFAAVMTALNSAFGLYRREIATSFAQTVGRVLLSLVAGMPVAYLLFAVLPNGTSVQQVLGYAILYAFCGMVLVRQAVQVVNRLSVGAKRVLIVGTGDEAVTVEASLRALRQPRFDVVGFYQTSTTQGSVVEGDRMVPR